MMLNLGWDWDSVPAHKPTVSKEYLKSVVTVADVLHRYADRQLRFNRCRCPICNDGRADAFVIDPRRNRYHCFRCGADGDQIDLVSVLCGLTFHDAIRRITNDYGLDDATEDAQRAADAAHALRKEEQRRQDEALRRYHAALDRYVALDRWSRLPPCDPRHTFAVRNISSARYYFDCAEDELNRQQ